MRRRERKSVRKVDRGERERERERDSIDRQSKSKEEQV